MKREFIYSDKWLDLLFEHRNRQYGAYMLRKRLPDNVLIGYSAALLFMGALVFTLYKFSAVTIEDVLQSIKDDTRTVKTYEIKLDPPKTNPAKENNTNKSFDKQPSKNFVPVVVDSTSTADDNNTNKEPETKNGDTSAIGKDTVGNETGEPPSGTGLSNSEPRIWAEIMPQFPGGEEAMFKFMAKNTLYPRAYLRENITGTVYVTFVVDTLGRITDVKPERGVAGFPEFENAAMQSIARMPKWTPGRQNGLKVPVVLTMPVRFNVKNSF